MVTSCEIKFDNNPNGTYLSGQMITGKVILNLTEKKKVRCKLNSMNNSRFYCSIFKV